MLRRGREERPVAAATVKEIIAVAALRLGRKELALAALRREWRVHHGETRVRRMEVTRHRAGARLHRMEVKVHHAELRLDGCEFFAERTWCGGQVAWRECQRLQGIKEKEKQGFDAPSPAPIPAAGVQSLNNFASFAQTQLEQVDQ